MNRFIDEFHPEQTDVALCGSMAHIDQWLMVIDDLRNRGLTVSTPDLTERINWSVMSDEDTIVQKGRLIRRHLANISAASVALVANYEKHGIKGYIGSNTFLEMGAAFLLDKPIYLLNPVPHQDNREEILALEPVVINSDLSKVFIAA